MSNQKGSTKGKLCRSKQARAKRQTLRAKYITGKKRYKYPKAAYNASAKENGDNATFYHIHFGYYTGIKSDNEYIKGLECNINNY